MLVTGGSASSRERGMATAELAVVLPGVLFVLALCLGALDLGLDTVRSLGAAGGAARSLARGDVPTAALAAAHRSAPEGATVTVTTTGAEVRVVVRCRRGWLAQALQLQVVPSGTAIAVREDAGPPLGQPP